ncbi:MAG: lipoyl synthase [Planctomycetes bacterium]|nr:lipoyl synthase [Planctomycetota bacterium]
MPETARKRLPPWMKRKLPRSKGQKSVENLLGEQSLVTVCEEANCPNKAQCFSHSTATFMILGDTCTRRCQFCSVNSGRPESGPDPDEPARLAKAAAAMKLEHVVVTSVDRDDLEDGGAEHWAAVVRALKAELPAAKIEILTPDFQGNEWQIDLVLESEPDIFNHNIETVPSLYRRIQPGSVYKRSLEVLRYAGSQRPDMTTKSGLMVGLGETRAELSKVFQDLRDQGVSMLTIGQYLKPAQGLAEVERYYPPEEFDEMRQKALDLGFPMVASGPYVRSSYNAKEQYLNG